MNGGLTASPPALCQLPFPSKSHHSCVQFGSFSSNPQGLWDRWFCSSNLKCTGNRSEYVSRSSFRCNSSTNPGGPSGQAENETKNVLDAFFLGKALAEALSERIESTVGEFLSTVGRLQAEQQKQVQEFQDEVLDRAKRAKEKAAREAMEARGLVPKSSTQNVSTVSHGVASGTTSLAANSAAPKNSSNGGVQPTSKSPITGNEDPLLGVSNED